MKKTAAVCFVFFLVSAGFPAVALSKKSSGETGRQLFTDPSFSGATSGKSCDSCHANGKGLDKAADNPKLTKLVNNCLTTRMAGKKIDGRAGEMRAIRSYIKSLAK